MNNSIYISNYNDILKNEILYKINNINNNNKKIKIILLDYPEINNINNNLYEFMKNTYYNLNTNINFNLYFLYYKNTIEDYIINKIYKESEESEESEELEYSKE